MHSIWQIVISCERKQNLSVPDAYEDLTENGCYTNWPVVIDERCVAWIEHRSHLGPALVIGDDFELLERSTNGIEIIDEALARIRQVS